GSVVQPGSALRQFIVDRVPVCLLGLSLMHSVLVVDDDQTLRGVLSSWVHSFGYYVHEAGTAEDALDTLAEVPADVALCDVNMPGQDGLWLASQIRERYPCTAIIMATAARDIEP